MANDNVQPRVMLWAVFRSCSTAVLRSISNIEGGSYYYEPYTCATFYGPEKVFPTDDAIADLPGADLAYDSSVNTFSWTKQMLQGEHNGSSLVFVKDHAYSLKAAGQSWEVIPSGYRHSFLIRNPNKTIPSWRKRNLENKPPGPMDEEATEEWQDMQMNSLNGGFQSLLELFEYVKKKIDPNPFVMDADDLVANPKAMMNAYCSAMGIPFTKKVLEWEDNGQPGNAKWITCRAHLKYFQCNYHSNAMKSRFFSKDVQAKTNSTPSPKVAEIIQRCMPYYQKLYQQRHVL